MFDFFKDAYVELNGFDVEKIKEEKKQQRENNKVLIGKSTKVIIFIVGIMYLFMVAINIYSIIKTGLSLAVIKYIFLSILDIAVMITVLINKKETQIAAIIGSVLFIIINFSMTNI